MSETDLLSDRAIVMIYILIIVAFVASLLMGEHGVCLKMDKDHFDAIKQPVIATCTNLQSVSEEDIDLHRYYSCNSDIVYSYGNKTYTKQNFNITEVPETTVVTLYVNPDNPEDIRAKYDNHYEMLYLQSGVTLLLFDIAGFIAIQRYVNGEEI